MASISDDSKNYQPEFDSQGNLSSVVGHHCLKLFCNLSRTKVKQKLTSQEAKQVPVPLHILRCFDEMYKNYPKKLEEFGLVICLHHFNKSTKDFFLKFNRLPENSELFTRGPVDNRKISIRINALRNPLVQ